MTPETRMTIAKQRFCKHVAGKRIEAVTEELFEMVNYILLSSKLQKESSVQFKKSHKRIQSFSIRRRVQCSAVEC
jgi:hypothetical protein